MSEQPIELVYTVTVRTYGQRRKVRRSVDQILARLVRLNFADAEVSVGKHVVR